MFKSLKKHVDDDDELIIPIPIPIPTTTTKKQKEDINIDSETLPIIIDFGSHHIKAGFRGDDSPRAVFPSQIGLTEPKGIKGVMIGMDVKDMYIGDEAVCKSCVLDMNNIFNEQSEIENKNWIWFEKLFHHIVYNELRICPEEHNFLITVPPLASNDYCENIMKMMFEGFNVNGLNLSLNSELIAMYQGVRKDTLVLDVGESLTTVCPISNWKMVKDNVEKISFSGKDVSKELCNLLLKRYPNDLFRTKQEKMIEIYLIKKHLCYVSERYKVDKYLKKLKFEGYELPDCQKISVGYEMFDATEILFNPSLFNLDNKEFKGIPKMIYDCYEKCDNNLQSEIDDIIICGGTTMTKGFVNRCKSETEKLLGDSVKNIKAKPERIYSAYLGGNLKSTLSSMKNQWIKKSDYDEFGAKVYLDKIN